MAKIKMLRIHDSSDEISDNSPKTPVNQTRINWLWRFRPKSQTLDYDCSSQVTSGTSDDAHDIHEEEAVYHSMYSLVCHIGDLYMCRAKYLEDMDEEMLDSVCSIIASKFVETEADTIRRVHQACARLNCDASTVYDAEFHVLETIDWRPLKGFELVKQGSS